MNPRDDWIVRRKDGGAVTCSVLIIFRGQKRLAAFPHAACESWLPSLPHRHLSEQGREGNPGSRTSSLWALLTCSGCPWLVTLKLSAAYSACITCVSKDSKRTLSSRWALAASAGGQCVFILWLERHKIINLKHSFFLLPQLSWSFPILFWFLFNKRFNNVIYLFFPLFWRIRRKDWNRMRGTLWIIFIVSLYDCKIVNTDYLLTLFYLELNCIEQMFASR